MPRLAIYLTNTERSGWDAPYPDYAVMTATMLAPLLPDYEIEQFDAVTGELPDQPEQYDAVVLTGSIANVTSHEAWMDKLYEHIQRLHAAKVKLIGICFGHQAIAHALGGEVAPANPQVGNVAVDIVRPQAWMQPAKGSVYLLCGNFQQVVCLPEGAEAIGIQAHCPFPLYQIAEHILGCQYHPEFSPAYMRLYVDFAQQKLGPQLVQLARQQLAQDHDGAVVAQWLANFIQA
jgi:GMP synthase-like glutamine amidotransferase